MSQHETQGEGRGKGAGQRKKREAASSGTWIEWLEEVGRRGNGDTLTELLELLVEDLEKMIEEGGWDQPPVLFEIHLEAYESERSQQVLAALSEAGMLGRPRRAVEVARDAEGQLRRREITEAEEGLLSEVGSQGVSKEKLEAMGEVFGQLLILIPVELGEGHPAEGLFGRKAGPEAVGALLVSEVWGYGEETLAQLAAGEEPEIMPSEDPNRVEMRNLVALLKDGTTVIGARERGEEKATVSAYREEAAEGGAQLGGRILESLRCYLGMSTGEPERELREVAAAAYLVVSVEREMAWPEPDEARAEGPGGKVRVSQARKEARQRQQWRENTQASVGDELARMMGPERGMVLVASGETEDWEQARVDALGAIEAFLGKLEGLTGDQRMREWIEQRLAALRWYDGAGVSRHMFSDVPGMALMTEVVKELANQERLSESRAAELVASAEKICAEGWPGEETVRWLR